MSSTSDKNVFDTKVEHREGDKDETKPIELENLQRQQVGTDDEGEDVLDDDDSGVMVYGPLFPSSDPAAASEVELAKSERISVPATNSEGQKQTRQDESRPDASQGGRSDKMDVLREKLENMWPFSKDGTAPPKDGQDTPTLSTSRVHFRPVHSGQKTQRVWVPSRDKISVQVMWWGYKMYITHSSTLFFH